MPFILLLSFCASAFSQSLKSPNISANALFDYWNSNYSNSSSTQGRNGVDIQEAELNFYADVDPYSRFNMVFTIHPEYSVNAQSKLMERKWIFEPEELYAESNQVPGFLFRLGKFKAAFGKHNLLHDHAFPFIEAPLINQNLLGDAGLNDTGASAAYMLPTSWFSELSAQYLSGNMTGFNAPTPGDGVGLGHWKNLLELNQDLTVEIGASYAAGKNFMNGQTTLLGSDLTFKWRPSQGGKYRSWILAGEVMRRNVGQPLAANDERDSGFDVWGQYQFAERWAVLARVENMMAQNSDASNVQALPNITSKKVSAEIVFNATEFSSFRAEYNVTDGPVGPVGQTEERKFLMQANFLIGSHPAHSY